MKIWGVRVALFGVALGVAALSAVVALTSQRAHDREVQAQSDALRLRVLDALERQFTTVVDREEARPFLQYSASSDALANNPVARGEWESAVVGYVQLAPDGRLSTPLATGQAWLNDWFGEPTPVVTRRSPTRTVRVRVPVPEMVVRQAPAPPPTALVLENNTFNDVGNQLNTEGLSRQQRGVTNFVTPVDQVQAFAQPTREIVGLTQVDVLTEVPGIVLEPATGMVDVVVGPMTGGSWSSSVWGLSRDLDINGKTWVQTVLFDRARLQTVISDSVVQEAGLHGVVSVDWMGGDYVFQAPFTGFHASVRLLDVQSGSVGWVWVLAALATALGLVSLVAVERSITGQQHLFHEREQFIATVTHELKTPVASMQLYAEMLEQGVAQTPEQRARYISVLRRETTRLARLIEQTLALTTREVPVAELRVPLGLAVEHAVLAMRPMLVERDVEVVLDVDAAQGDVPEDALAQILTNVLDNASKFLRPGDERSVEVSARGRCVTVVDCGPGIAESERSLVFRPFHRGEDEHTRTTTGTGLGLAVVARLCAQIGARVSIDNRLSRGAIVTIRLAP
ncbi:MAG: signal transduction histidine kinase [Myxococcota bacterium]|jgi:signal transduction histidine kinase